MENEVKVKADDRWMEDSEASHCLDCNAEFSFLLRKVCFFYVTAFLVINRKQKWKFVAFLEHGKEINIPRWLYCCMK